MTIEPELARACLSLVKHLDALVVIFTIGLVLDFVAGVINALLRS